MNAKFGRVKEIFLAAVEKQETAEREAYMHAVCGEDEELRRQVDALLGKHAQAGSFLEAPAQGPMVTADEACVVEQPGTVLGPYKLLQQIGEGGFGVVFMAEQKEPVRRKVAVKVLKPGMDTRQVVARFEAERQALALMDHPNIAHVHDGGQTASGRPYFVMELVRGSPMTEYCDQNQLCLRERLELFVTVCQAVQHAHQKGIIHRDLKPSNILISSYDGTPVPKVIDFGIAKALSGNLTDKSVFTRFEQMIGTPIYMSPEQAGQSSLDVDTRSDVYSLGVLLYELLTGTTPFDKEQFSKLGYDEVRRIICETEPPKPSTQLSTLGQAATTASTNRQSDPRKLSQQIRGELDWIVLKSLEKDRNRRYESASAFAADVQRYLNDEPVQACPPSAGYLVRKFARRNKGVIFATIAVLLALSAGLTGTTLALFDAQHQRDVAEKARSAVVKAHEAQEAERRQRVTLENNLQMGGKLGHDQRVLLEFFLKRLLATCLAEGQRGALGKGVSVRKAMDAAEKEIAHTFKDQPCFEAIIRASLGQNYFALGEKELAITQVKRALESVKAEFPPNNLYPLDIELRFADALGNTDQALVLCEQILAKSDNPHHMAHGISILAGKYCDAGRFDLGLPMQEQSLKKMKATYGPDDPATLIFMSTLALYYCNAGKLDIGLPLHKETIEKMKHKLGPDHPETLITMRNLAFAYRRDDQLDRALPLTEEIFNRRKAKLGPDHLDTLRSMRELASDYRDANQPDRALSLWEAAVKLTDAKLGPDDPFTLINKKELAMAYQAAGKFDRALPLLREWLRRSKKQDAESTDTAGALACLGLNLLHQKNDVEAESILRECWTIRKNKQRDAWDTFNAMAMLGGALLGQKKYDQAEPLLLDGYKGLKDRKAKIPAAARVRLTEALERLVQLYDAWGEKDKAAKWRRELAAHRQEIKKNNAKANEQP